MKRRDFLKFFGLGLAASVTTRAANARVCVRNPLPYATPAQLTALADRVNAMESARFPVPDYANIESTNRITANNATWTANRSGFVLLMAGKAGANNPSFRINEVLIATVDTNWGHPAGGDISFVLPIARNDAVRINGGRNFGCWFIPVKFVSAN